MTQYLLSVWHDRDATPEDIYPDPEEREASYADTGRFNEEIRASGNWVFAGGLHAPSTATVVDGTGDEPGRRGPRPRRRPRAGRPRLEGLPRQGRGPSLPRRVTL